MAFREIETMYTRILKDSRKSNRRNEVNYAAFYVVCFARVKSSMMILSGWKIEAKLNL